MSFFCSGDRTGLLATIDGVADFGSSHTIDKLRRLTRLEQTGQTGGNSVAEKRVDFKFNAMGRYEKVTRYKDTDGFSANKVMTSPTCWRVRTVQPTLSFPKSCCNGLQKARFLLSSHPIVM